MRAKKRERESERTREDASWSKEMMPYITSSFSFS
jgi:hypothetical protein